MRCRGPWLLLIVSTLAGCPAQRTAQVERPIPPGDDDVTETTTLVPDATTPVLPGETGGDLSGLEGLRLEELQVPVTRLPVTTTAGGDGEMAVGVDEEVGAGLQRDAVRQVVQAQAGRLRGCYDRLLVGVATETAGRVSIRFHVEPSGLVRQAEVDSATLTDPTFLECVRGVVQNLHFPTTDAPTIVTYPFRFEGLPGGE